MIVKVQAVLRQVKQVNILQAICQYYPPYGPGPGDIYHKEMTVYQRGLL